MEKVSKTSVPDRIKEVDRTPTARRCHVSYPAKEAIA